MRRTLKILLTLALAGSLMLLSGCWNYQEVENLNIVGGFAIDKGVQGHNFHLTYEVLDLSGGGGDQNTGMKGKLIESEGDTIADAVKNASRSSDKALYFSDCKFVILSKEIASAGLTPILDWLNRDPQPRFTMQMFVSQEKTAEDIFKGAGVGKEVVSFKISKIMEQTSSISRSPEVRLVDADNVLLGEGMDLALPSIRLNTQTDKPQIEVYGTSVFNYDKYVGELDDQQTQDYLFITNHVKNGVLLTGVKPDDNQIALQIQQNATKIAPEINGADNIKMDVDIKTKTAFDEENTYHDYLLKYGIDAFEQFAQKSVEKRVASTLESVQKDFGCDIFGFGRKVYEKDPNLWREIKPKWKNYFKKIVFKVTSEMQITNTGFAYPKGHD